MKHLHHLVPKHRGGTDADGLVEVSVIQHAMFHYCEWRLHGHWQDKTAWKMLVGAQTHPRTGSVNSEERRAEISRRNKELWATPEHHAKMSEAFRKASQTPEKREQNRRQMLKVRAAVTPEQEAHRKEMHRIKWSKVYNIQKGGESLTMTIKQFCAHTGGNLASCKTRVSNYGVYKGWVFTPI